MSDALSIVEHHGFEDVVGTSPAMEEVKLLIARVAAGPPSTVLITGEAGTETEVTAKAIHYRSERAGKPFVTVAPAALPEPLLETELFGDTCGGTMFLDEVGELPATLQAKLLSFLEQHVDVPVIAGTNRDLEHEVALGHFDRALFQCLTATTIVLPPLRDRGDDVVVAAEYYVERFNRELNRKVRGLDAAATALVKRYRWPGNIRELRAVIELAMLSIDRDWLTPQDFPSLARAAGASAFTLPPEGVNLEDIERDLLVQALERSRWNQTHAGRLLKINRDQVRYRIEKFGLRSAHGGDSAGAAPRPVPVERATA